MNTHYVSMDVSRSIVEDVDSKWSQDKRQIEKALYVVAQAQEIAIRDITWVPKITPGASAVEIEVSEAFSAIDSEHIQ